MAFRKPRVSTTARGYGADHRRARAAYVQAFVPGQPCVLCGHPLLTHQGAHLDHLPDKQGYRGLSHPGCNIRDGARRGAQIANGRRVPERRSRDW